ETDVAHPIDGDIGDCSSLADGSARRVGQPLTRARPVQGVSRGWNWGGEQGINVRGSIMTTRSPTLISIGISRAAGSRIIAVAAGDFIRPQEEVAEFKIGSKVTIRFFAVVRKAAIGEVDHPG